MTVFALYRLPYGNHCTLIEQTSDEPVRLTSVKELDGRSGFVVAPFHPTAEYPVLLIRPDRVSQLPVEQPEAGVPDVLKSSSYREEYAIDFANFHSQLTQGAFRKIVLARCATLETAHIADTRQLFWKACQRYPRLFIALVSLPDGTCWLTATPEILLEGVGDEWRTVALAGTMRLKEDELNGEGEHVCWSTKNIQEQRYVATYIAECLEQFTSEFSEEGPFSVRAANLVHLRSDFTFTLPSNDHLGDLLQALYPTPAVCGLPKRETFHFITHNEHTPRLYYSGFQGWLGEEETHLYVSLRCMKVEDRRYYLYAGGGLLKDSTEEQEWQETEAKLETMRGLLVKSE